MLQHHMKEANQKYKSKKTRSTREKTVQRKLPPQHFTTVTPNRMCQDTYTQTNSKRTQCPRKSLGKLNGQSTGAPPRWERYVH